jgi:hypothetical protein
VSQHQSAPDLSRFRTSPVSFASRSGRLTTGQQRAWDTRRDVYLVEAPRHFGRMSVDPGWRFDAAEVFGRTAPLVLEIGSGSGEAACRKWMRRPSIAARTCSAVNGGPYAGRLVMSGWEEIALIENPVTGDKELNPEFAGKARPYVWSNIWGAGTE